MRRRTDYDHSPAGRWGGSGQFHNERPYTRYGNSSYIEHENRSDEYVSRGTNNERRGDHGASGGGGNYGDGRNRDDRSFGGGSNFGGAHNYGSGGRYGGSTISGGGGGFGSPSDYGAGGSGGNYSGGYYGSSGSYGSGSDYRGGSSYAGGGNYSDGPGSAYGNSGPMPGYDNSNQGSYHGRTGYRSNYTSMASEFDAVMEDPMISSNYSPVNDPHRRDYRDYNLEDNYGSTRGRNSDFNNYRGRTDYNTTGGRTRFDRSRDEQPYRSHDQHRHDHESWFERARDNVRGWFGGNDR